MNFFIGLVLVLLISGLVQDYKKDPALHHKAKIFHSICLALICISYANAFGIVGGLLSNFEKFRSTYEVPVGLISGELHLVIFVLHTILSAVILLICFQLIRRRESSRRVFIYILPVPGIFEIFNFYRGWMTVNEVNSMPLLGILTGTLIIGFFITTLILIYNSRMMKLFFNGHIETQDEVIIDTQENNSQDHEKL